MELTYGQLESTLTTHFRIHPDRVGTFRSRIKQLQRLGFPPGVNVGRGSKMSYSASHLYQLVAAFELINLGMPAATATDIVNARWRNFGAGFALALSMRAKAQARIYLRVLNCSLAEMQGSSSLESELPNVFVEDVESLENILSHNSRRLTHTYAIICATDVCLNINKALETVAQVAFPWMDKESGDWLVENSKADWWMMANEGWKFPWLAEGNDGSP